MTSATTKVEAWWATLSDYARCYLVAYAVAVDSLATGQDVAYAVSKPWKYMRDAYDYAHQEEEP